MKTYTVNELLKECEKQIKLGNGDKTIMISKDDEGNGYHYLIYSFTPAKDVFDVDFYMNEIDEDIAKLEDTIILG